MDVTKLYTVIAASLTFILKKNKKRIGKLVCFHLPVAEPSLTNAFFRLQEELWVLLRAMNFMGHLEEKIFIYFTFELQPEVIQKSLHA